MKTKYFTILVYVIMLISSLIVISDWESIQEGIWYITGEYGQDSDAFPSVAYDYSLMYLVVLHAFVIIGAVIFGINFVIVRIRK